MGEAGRTGRRGHQGFYSYEAGKRGRPGARRVDPAVYEILGVTPEPKKCPPLDTISERLGLAMVGESLRCLSDGVLRSSRDGDVAAIFGLGFPAFRGGPFRYADHLGAAGVLGRLERLEAAHGPRFAAPGMVVDRARTGHPYHD